MLQAARSCGSRLAPRGERKGFWPIRARAKARSSWLAAELTLRRRCQPELLLLLRCAAPPRFGRPGSTPKRALTCTTTCLREAPALTATFAFFIIMLAIALCCVCGAGREVLIRRVWRATRAPGFSSPKGLIFSVVTQDPAPRWGRRQERARSAPGARTRLHTPRLALGCCPGGPFGGACLTEVPPPHVLTNGGPPAAESRGALRAAVLLSCGAQASRQPWSPAGRRHAAAALERIPRRKRAQLLAVLGCSCCQGWNTSRVCKRGRSERALAPWRAALQRPAGACTTHAVVPPARRCALHPTVGWPRIRQQNWDAGKPPCAGRDQTPQPPLNSAPVQRLRRRGSNRRTRSTHARPSSFNQPAAKWRRRRKKRMVNLPRRHRSRKKECSGFTAWASLVVMCTRPRDGQSRSAGLSWNTKKHWRK